MTDNDITECRNQADRLRARERRDALARTIAHRLVALGIDELRVLDALVVRLQLGRERYGELDLSKPRDWAKEECEEHLDAIVYRACALLAERDVEDGEQTHTCARGRGACNGTRLCGCPCRICLPHASLPEVPFVDSYKVDE